MKTKMKVKDERTFIRIIILIFSLLIILNIFCSLLILFFVVGKFTMCNLLGNVCFSPADNFDIIIFSLFGFAIISTISLLSYSLWEAIEYLWKEIGEVLKC